MRLLCEIIGVAANKNCPIFFPDTAQNFLEVLDKLVVPNGQYPMQIGEKTNFRAKCEVSREFGRKVVKFGEFLRAQGTFLINSMLF